MHLFYLPHTYSTVHFTLVFPIAPETMDSIGENALDDIKTENECQEKSAAAGDYQCSSPESQSLLGKKNKLFVFSSDKKTTPKFTFFY